MLNKTLNSILKFSSKEAFVIDKISYSYSDFGKKITSIITEINKHKTSDNQIIGIIADNTFDTFASIYAAWFSGCAFVPLSVNTPIERNINIAKQLNLKLIIDTNGKTNINNIQTINSTKLTTDKISISTPTHKPNNLSYILFTSGSTGVPKGVPISVKNINSYFNNFFKIGYNIDETDRFIQSFELTFDYSITSYIIPLSIGATLYTPKKKGVKYLNIIKCIINNKITFINTVPSSINLLAKQFNNINLTFVKYMIFAAEAASETIINKWQNCIPNADIYNCYGTTETTIITTIYKWKRNHLNQSYNDNISIGKPYGDNEILIIDKNNIPISDNRKGEICITGTQVFNGYFKMPKKNKTSFINIKEKKYYRTGDIGFYSETGNIMYVGRADSQVQIQGNRVELGEIKTTLKKLLQKNEIEIITYNINEIMHIVAFVKNLQKNTDYIKIEMAKIVPHYMIPSYIININEFTYSTNGKTDKHKLQEIFNKYLSNER